MQYIHPAWLFHFWAEIPDLKHRKYAMLVELALDVSTGPQRGGEREEEVYQETQVFPLWIKSVALVLCKVQGNDYRVKDECMAELISSAHCPRRMKLL